MERTLKRDTVVILILAQMSDIVFQKQSLKSDIIVIELKIICIRYVCHYVCVLRKQESKNSLGNMTKVIIQSSCLCCIEGVASIPKACHFQDLRQVARPAIQKYCDK